ncbi:uncharacterized protein LOC119689658 isoform X2 [Teleopsis dalmanni]|uniref:uncharacterized protein LOC119689658 isoform X2 n=1 Tax=Teleopsis dalmanni TaxID=139649 RepID=UPI0018CDA255|nr:uncharacterized protein LOC119689658 isoform X2 [Teleopsis dalmanni]
MMQDDEGCFPNFAKAQVKQAYGKAKISAAPAEKKPDIGKSFSYLRPPKVSSGTKVDSASLLKAPSAKNDSRPTHASKDPTITAEDSEEELETAQDGHSLTYAEVCAKRLKKKKIIRDTTKEQQPILAVNPKMRYDLVKNFVYLRRPQSEVTFKQRPIGKLYSLQAKNMQPTVKSILSEFL